ncbi:MAG: glycosyltransferase family 4 protein [Nitrospirae bacterium]|nr:glycosyltransferase family 4 protein [Candidatus Manganitrophaceae bacterium]
MKIIFFTENHYRGGLDTFLTTLINHWPYPEDDLALICNRSHPGLDWIKSKLARQCEITPHRLPGQSEWYRGNSQRKFLSNRLAKGCLSLLRKTLAYPFFMVHVMALIFKFKKMRYDRLMVVNGGYPASLSCRAASIAWNLAGKRPLSIHNFHSLAQASPVWYRWIESLIDRGVLNSSRAMVSVSDACIHSLHKLKVFRGATNSRFIYNGISPGKQQCGYREAALSDLGIPEEAPLCLMLATYHPYKGHDFFFRAFSEVIRSVPNARALICGDGRPSEIFRVRCAISSLGLDQQVIVQGHRADVDLLLQRAQVLVVPSQAFESFSLVIVEAMARRLPVVATRVGGIPEVMPDGMGGLLCDVNDVEGFGRNILKILSDLDLAKKLGEMGFRRYSDKFTADKMAKEYAGLVRLHDHAFENQSHFNMG